MTFPNVQRCSRTGLHPISLSVFPVKRFLKHLGQSIFLSFPCVIKSCCLIYRYGLARQRWFGPRFQRIEVGRRDSEAERVGLPHGLRRRGSRAARVHRGGSRDHIGVGPEVSFGDPARAKARWPEPIACGRLAGADGLVRWQGEHCDGTEDICFIHSRLTPQPGPVTLSR